MDWLKCLVLLYTIAIVSSSISHINDDSDSGFDSGNGSGDDDFMRPEVRSETETSSFIIPSVTITTSMVISSTPVDNTSAVGMSHKQYINI